MPHFIKIGLSTGLMVLAFVLFITPVHAQEWALKTSGVTNDLNNLACVDEWTCYAVGGAPFTGGPGIIIKTTDGGETWVRQTTPITDTVRSETYPLRGISCPTPLICYAAGDGGTILKTINGGELWTRQPVANLSNWPGQAQPWFWDIWATSETTAVAAGNIGAIYRTVNGGDTWTQIVVREVETHNLAGVFFANASTGWILGGSNVLKTTDGGLTWGRQLPAQLGALMWDAFSLDGETVWISGSTVHKSPDSGASWARLIGSTGITYRGIEFVDSDTGWIVGTGGFIKKTVDGGTTWVSQTSRTTKILRDIQCIGPGLCYAVGDDGVIVRYGTPPPPPQADLTIGDRTLTCPAGELGLEFAEYRYSVVVRNIGTGDAGAFTVRLQGLDAAGNPVGTPLNNIVTGLADGVSATIDGQANVGLLNPTATATATVRITADILGQVAESNETNNVATMTQTCATATTPTNRSPNPPRELAQKDSAGARDEAVGFVDDDREIIFKGVISDPDADQTVALDVEVKPLGTVFDGIPFRPGLLIINIPSGILAGEAGLFDPGSYHWRARTRDMHGATSAWVSFGGNAESAADFTVSLPSDTEPPTAPPNVQRITPRTDRTPIFSWEAATDNVGVTGYEIKLDNSTTTVNIIPIQGVGMVLTYTVSDSVILPFGNTLTFYVRAFDAAGNRGPWGTASFSLQAPTEETPAAAEPGITPAQPAEPAIPAVPPTPTLTPEEKVALQQKITEERREQIEKITVEAPKILGGFSAVVEEKQITRDEVKEQFAAQKIEFIAKVALPTIAIEKRATVEEAMKAFVAYGAPTKAEVLEKPIEKLGAGERAGVVNSFKEAFGKLPETEKDWEDVMKIAIGRFPSQTNPDREKEAEAIFKKVYLRNSVRTQAHDNACVTVISYGLRPDKRNLDSEKAAIKTFKAVYKKVPQSASDWDTVRCIAYSGATR